MLASLLLPLALAATARQVWTVDDDGPADFSSITKAILSASEGDVLLVQPGTYDPFELDKSLAIIAPAGASRPYVAGTSRASGVNECSFVRLSFEVLELSSIAGRVVIDDCQIKPPFEYGLFYFGPSVALKAAECAQVLVTRTSVEGPHAFEDSPDGSTYCAVHLIETEAAFIQCSLKGGQGGDGSIEYAFLTGGTGLRAESSTVSLAGTNVFGGHGASACGAIGCAGCGSFCGGPGGNGVWTTSSDLTARGDPSNVIRGGSPGVSGQPGGVSIRAVSSLVIASGVTLPDGIVPTDSVILTPRPAEPFLTVTGDDASGLRTLNLFGPKGDPALLALSLAPDLAHLPTQFEGSLWLQLSEILLVIPMIMQGQTLAASVPIAVPPVPDLVGLTGIAQALCPSFPGTLNPAVPLLTNAGQMVVH